jgi:hypothetical protein
LLYSFSISFLHFSFSVRPCKQVWKNPNLKYKVANWLQEIGP